MSSDLRRTTFSIIFQQFHHSFRPFHCRMTCSNSTYSCRREIHIFVCLYHPCPRRCGVTFPSHLPMPHLKTTPPKENRSSWSRLFFHNPFFRNIAPSFPFGPRPLSSTYDNSNLIEPKSTNPAYQEQKKTTFRFFDPTPRIPTSQKNHFPYRTF